MPICSTKIGADRKHFCFEDDILFENESSMEYELSGEGEDDHGKDEEGEKQESNHEEEVKQEPEPGKSEVKEEISSEQVIKIKHQKSI